MHCTSADQKTALYGRKETPLLEVLNHHVWGKWVTRRGHNQHAKPGRLRRWRGSNVPVLWDAGAPLAAAALLAVVCVAAGLWTQVTEASTATARLSHSALVKPFTHAGKWPCETFAELHHHPAFAITSSLLYSIRALWAYSCPSCLHSAPQCCLVDSSHRGGSAGALVLTPPLHQGAAIGCQAPCLQHSVTCVLITYLSVTTALKKHVNSQSNWGWLIPITD